MAAPTSTRGVGLESVVTLFPQDPRHRLVGDDLSAFLDRLTERIVALGSGATARLKAGRFEAEAHTLLDLLESLAAAREQARGREDLSIRIEGEPTDEFAKFIGRGRVSLEFQAWVAPRALREARPCAGCGWPLDFDGFSSQLSCGRRDCGDGEPLEKELECCWSLSFLGDGPDGIGERFVEESRRLEGSSFFEALEGIGRARLFEWHSWS